MQQIVDEKEWFERERNRGCYGWYSDNEEDFVSLESRARRGKPERQCRFEQPIPGMGDIEVGMEWDDSEVEFADDEESDSGNEPAVVDAQLESDSDSQTSLAKPLSEMNIGQPGKTSDPRQSSKLPPARKADGASSFGGKQEGGGGSCEARAVIDTRLTMGQTRISSSSDGEQARRCGVRTRTARKVGDGKPPAVTQLRLGTSLLQMVAVRGGNAFKLIHSAQQHALVQPGRPRDLALVPANLGDSPVNNDRGGALLDPMYSSASNRARMNKVAPITKFDEVPEGVGTARIAVNQIVPITKLDEVRLGTAGTAPRPSSAPPELLTSAPASRPRSRRKKEKGISCGMKGAIVLGFWFIMLMLMLILHYSS